PRSALPEVRGSAPSASVATSPPRSAPAGRCPAPVPPRHLGRRRASGPGCPTGRRRRREPPAHGVEAARSDLLDCDTGRRSAYHLPSTIGIAAGGAAALLVLALDVDGGAVFTAEATIVGSALAHRGHRAAIARI